MMQTLCMVCRLRSLVFFSGYAAMYFVWLSRFLSIWGRSDLLPVCPWLDLWGQYVITSVDR